MNESWIMNSWMNEQWIHECMNERKINHECMEKFNECMYAWKNGWIIECMN